MASLPLIFRLLLSLAYLVAGVLVLLYRPFQSAMFDLPFALACIAYGLFRGYRAVRDYRAETDEA